MNDPPPPAKFEFYNKEIYKQLFFYFFRTLIIKKSRPRSSPRPSTPTFMPYELRQKSHYLIVCAPYSGRRGHLYPPFNL